MSESLERPAPGQELKQLPWIELLRHGRALYTIILNVGIGLHAVDVFVITTVMPAVVRDLGGIKFYAWAMMLYMVASIVGAASGNVVSAALGARRGYSMAAAIFFVGTLGCAVAPVMAVLLVFRTVQGFGGGLIVAQSMGLVRELYEDSLRTRALATISGIWAVASLLGPLIGGFFGEIGWWRGAFFSTLPLIALFGLLAWRKLPPSEHAASVPRLPIRRLALLAAGVISVGICGTVDSLALQVLLLVGAAIAVLLTFRLDGAASEPLFPPRPLSLDHTVGVAFWMFFLQSITHSAAGLFMPLALQELHGLGSLAAGYFGAVLALGWTLSSFASAGWTGRAVTAAIGGGPVLAALSLAAISAGIVDMPPVVIAAAMVVTGLGIGMCSLHLTAATLAGTPAAEGRRVASAIPSVRMLGIAFGSALAGLIANLAGLGRGISVETVTNSARAVIGTAAAAAAGVALLSLLLLRLRTR